MVSQWDKHPSSLTASESFPKKAPPWEFGILVANVTLCPPQQPHVHIPSENEMPRPLGHGFEALLLEVLWFCQLVSMP